METGLISLWQRLKNCTQAIVPLSSGQLLFGIWSEIDLFFHQTAVRMDRFANAASRVPPLQREIVHHPKKPAPKIFARPPKMKMAVQRKKNILDDLLAVVHRQAKGESIAQQTSPEFVEQSDDFVFQLGGQCRQCGVSCSR